MSGSDDELHASPRGRSSNTESAREASGRLSTRDIVGGGGGGRGGGGREGPGGGGGKGGGGGGRERRREGKGWGRGVGAKR